MMRYSRAPWRAMTPEGKWRLSGALEDSMYAPRTAVKGETQASHWSAAIRKAASRKTESRAPDLQQESA